MYCKKEGRAVSLSSATCMHCLVTPGGWPLTQDIVEIVSVLLMRVLVGAHNSPVAANFRHPRGCDWVLTL